MAVRSSMADLIATVRTKIYDPAGASQFFTDQDVQDMLDRVRLDVQYDTLRPRATLQPGAILWTDYYSRYEWWETDVSLIWGNFAPLSPDTSDYLVGHWTFTAGQYPPVYIKGKTYDVWRASADLLEARMASVALTAFNFSSDGQSFSRQQQFSNLQTIATQYRRKSRARMVEMARADTIGEQSDSRRGLIGPVSSGVPFITGP